MRVLAITLVAAALALVQVPLFTCHCELGDHGPCDHGPLDHGPLDHGPLEHDPGDHTLVFQHAGVPASVGSQLPVEQVTAALAWIGLPAPTTQESPRTEMRITGPPGAPVLETVRLLL